MAEFPRYESKGQLTTQQPAPLTPTDNTGAVVAETGQKIGSSLQDIAMKFNETMIATRRTVAKVNSADAIDEIHQQATLDGNVANQKDYVAKLEESKQKNLQGLDPLGKLEITHDYNNAGIQLTNIYRNKNLELNTVAVDRRIQRLEQNPTPDSLAHIKNLLHKEVASNRLKPEFAYKREVEAEKEIKQNTFLIDLNKDPAISEKKLNTNAYGFDIDKLEKAKQHQEYAVRMANVETTHELIDMANNGLDIKQPLEEAFLTKRIANSTYKALQEQTNSKVGPTAGTDNQTYYDITHYLLSKDADPVQATNRIIKANSEGKLSLVDMKKIYDMHLIPTPEGRKSIDDAFSNGKFEQIKAVYDANEKAMTDKKQWWRTGFGLFNQNTAGPDKEKKVAESTQKLVDAVNQEQIKPEDIPVAAEKILSSERLKQHPTWAALPEKGRKGVDRFGNKVIVYPNGRVVRAE